jgi:hypothetical protein
MVKTVGYILQYFDEESLIPNGPGKRLYTDFDQVLNDAHELIQKWYEINTDANDGPVEYQKVTQAMVDAQQSVLMFRSRDVFIWIEIVFV